MSQQQAERERVLTIRDIFASWWRWLFFSHANYNWERYQGTGFAHAMAPIIEKLYDTKEEISAALKRHLVFFNTEPDTGGIIHGIIIAMEERRALGDEELKSEIDGEMLNSIKTGLMGPFAGLGDTLKQGLWFPVWQSIGIGLAVAAGGALTGLLGPFVYLIAALVYTFAFGWWLYIQGYLQGQELVTRLLEGRLLDQVRTGASVLGASVLGALGAQLVTVSTGLRWTVVAGTGEEAVTQTFSLQEDLFDAIYPALLPLITILVIIWLLRRGASIIDMLLYIFGITLASALIESWSRLAIQTGNALGIFSSRGVPTLIGFALLIAGALFAGQRREGMRAAVGFIVGVLVIGVVFGFLSIGRTEPLQIIAHF